MKLLDKALKFVGLRRVKNEAIAPGTSSFQVLMDWILGATAVDRDLRTQLGAQRREARILARENPVVRQYLNLLANNVIGKRGMRLQAQVRNNDRTLNKFINDKIESGWNEFWQSPWADGRISGVHGERLLIRTVATDGEAFVRKLVGFPNKWGFALQMIDPELVDHTLNRPATAEQNEIRMGIEIDGWGRAVAIYVFTSFPDQAAQRQRKRIPAEQIIHLYDPDRVSQTRGITWLYSVISPLKGLNGYVEAAIVAARTAACAVPVFKQSTPELTDVTDQRDYTVELDPGKGFTLPPGLELQDWDPNHPSDRFGDFVKASLRFVASGLGVSYNALANDLENVNYSSIRSGLLIERDNWRSLQCWWVDAFRQPVYAEFVRCALLSGGLVLDSRDPRKFLSVKWIARGWAWVDPLKDVNAAVIAIENLLGSRKKYLSEQGEDFEEIVLDQQDEKAIAQTAGLPLSAAAMDDGSIDRLDDDEDAPKVKSRLRLAVLNALLDEPEVDNDRMHRLMNLYRKGL